MADWYEVFDNEEVQGITRRRAFILARNLALLLGLAGLCYVITSLLGFSALFSYFVVASVSVPAVFYTNRQLRDLHGIVWCLKISDRRIGGYDYARRKIDFDWIKVDRIELGTSGLVVHPVHPKGPEKLEVSHRYPDFAQLSHRIVEYADFYEIPVYIDGGRWQDVNVKMLYPFAESDMG